MGEEFQADLDLSAQYIKVGWREMRPQPAIYINFLPGEGPWSYLHGGLPCISCHPVGPVMGPVDPLSYRSSGQMVMPGS